LNSVSAVIRKNWHLIIFIACLLIFIFLVMKFITVMAPFLIGLVIAYLLLPIVVWMEKHLPGGKRHPGLKRIFIIIGVYFVGLLVIAGAVFYLVTVITGTASVLFQNLPQLISNIVARIQGWLAAIRLDVPASLLQQYDQTIQNAGVTAVDELRKGLGQGFSVAVSGAGLILGFLSLPLVVFFMLKDWEKLSNSFFNSMPSWISEHARKVTDILQRVLGRYIRGQILLSIIIGLLVFIMLTIMRIEFAPALAVWAALMEFIPVLGPWLTIIAGVIITLATDPTKAIWLVLGYLIIQQLESNFLVPRIQGSVMKMNPIFIIMFSLLGAYLAGLIGFMVAVPVAATVIELLKYFRRSAQPRTAT
jgi:predicted PurR-regulated permease PerM